MTEGLESQLYEICYNVYRGVKPCSMLPVANRDVNSVIKYCVNSSCSCFKEFLSDGWETIWIVKNKDLLPVIKSLPKEPKTPADHCLLGFLFGYSIDSICEFVKETFDK